RDRGWGPLRQDVRAVQRGRALLVGDAAGYLDAITGEGLSLAFHHAAAAADALVASAERGDDRQLRRYRARHRAVHALPDAIIRGMLWLEARPPLRRRVLRALAAEPALFGRLLAVHGRAAAPHAVVRPDLARFALRLARSQKRSSAR
ncbi:MAG: FAD-dependent monooxygenase, partial [Acidobacteriota bacterium]